MTRIAGRHEPPPKRRSRLDWITWAVKLGMVLGVLVLFAVIAGVLYIKLTALEGPTTVVIGGQEATVEPSADLSAAERAYLRGYLLLHGAEIEQARGELSAPVSFIVESGESAAGIAERLEGAGLIDNATLFRHYLRYYDLDAGLEAGDYSLQGNMTIPEIAQMLSHGLAQEIELRVVEGWRLEQIADHLRANPDLGIDPQEFLQLARRSSAQGPDGGAAGADEGGVDAGAAAPDLPAGATLEGYLFPDTYRLPADATATDLINTMLYTFGQRVTSEMIRAMAERGLTLHAGITLASIVEREAQLPEERPLIAGVFINRLMQGIKLDADPTVQYALGFQEETGEWWKRPLLYEDLEVDSAYNTYLYPGLPPGPIANPGLASISAVAYPAETSYLFFVVDCTSDTPGAHSFAETFEEHQANVARCQ